MPASGRRLDYDGGAVPRSSNNVLSFAASLPTRRNAAWKGSGERVVTGQAPHRNTRTLANGSSSGDSSRPLEVMKHIQGQVTKGSMFFHLSIISSWDGSLNGNRSPVAISVMGAILLRTAFAACTDGQSSLINESVLNFNYYQRYES
jgi:hypothetical protein